MIRSLVRLPLAAALLAVLLLARPVGKLDVLEAAARGPALLVLPAAVLLTVAVLLVTPLLITTLLITTLPITTLLITTLLVALALAGLVFGLDLPFGRLVGGVLGVGLLGLLHGWLALAVGAAVPNRGLAIGVAAALAGVGYLIDRWLGTDPWFLCIGALVGNAAGLYMIWLRAARMDREEAAVAAELAAGSGPT